MKDLIKNNKYCLFLAFCFVVLCLARRSMTILALDASVYEMAQQFSYSKAWLLFWGLVTRFGNGEFVYGIAGLAGLAYLIRRPSWKKVRNVLFLMAIFFVNPVLKYIFAVPRPVGLSPYYPELTTPSFPSGHAFNSVVLFYFLPRFYIGFIADTLEKKQTFAWMLKPIVLILGVVMIAYSRVFLGAHWASDVMGGALLALVLTRVALLVLSSEKI